MTVFALGPLEVGLLVLVPVVVIVLVVVIVSAVSSSREPRYRPGLPWVAEPTWIGTPGGQVAGAPVSSGPDEATEVGGAGVRW